MAENDRRMQERWYCLFLLLDSGIADTRILRQRLSRFLIVPRMRRTLAGLPAFPAGAGPHFHLSSHGTLAVLRRRGRDGPAGGSTRGCDRLPASCKRCRNPQSLEMCMEIARHKRSLPTSGCTDCYDTRCYSLQLANPTDLREGGAIGHRGR